jgi:hypothetical protein
MNKSNTKKVKKDFNLRDFINNNEQFNLSILGLTGSGKTYFSRKFCTEFLRYKKRNIIVCDTKHEFNDLKPFSVEDLDKRGIIRKVKRINIEGTIYEFPYEISEFCASVCWEWNPCLLYLEEVANIVQSKAESLPTSHLGVYKILQQGRARKCNCLVATQKISQIHEAFLDESNYIFVFAISKTESIKLEKKLGLEEGSLIFELPKIDEIGFNNLNPSNWLDLYSFCRINQMREVEWFNPIEFKEKRKKEKKIFSLNEVKEDN